MQVTWEAPGPGQWALDRSHMPGGCTPIVQDLMAKACPAGTSRMFRELGSPVDRIDAAFVHGHVYTRVRPLVSPDKPAKRLPPNLVLKVAVRLHPEMRRRARTAARVAVEEPWKQVIHDWHHGEKARIESGNLALQDVSLDALSDVALMEHVRDCHTNCQRNWEHHFWLHGYDLGPLGQYLWEVQQWGPTAIELLALLEGASPSTTGPAKDAAAIRAAAAAAGAEPSTLAELRAISPEVAAAVDRYLRTRAWVLFSRYDLDGIALGERPDLVLASIMCGEDRDTSREVGQRTAAVRARIAAEHRERFDDLLDQARLAMDLRDDNGPTTAEWPAGLLRRALLEVGTRMVRLEMIGDPSLALELQPAELDAAMPSDLPSGVVLSERRTRRAAQRGLTAPELLGPAELTPPLEVLPLSLRRGVGAVQVVMQHLGMDGSQAASGLHGSGIGSTSVRAVACVASSPEDALDLLEPGQVLVVAATTPAYNLVLSMAGGVVTAEGGPMSHAAVIARELGIPAVIGARSALVDIPHGALIEVDPVAGEVRVL